MVENKRMNIYAFVIMDNHIHIIWQSLAGYTYAENRLAFMKFTAQQIIKELKNNSFSFLEQFEVNLKDRKYQIWKRNPLSIELISPKVYEQKLDYIHENPVKANLCSMAEHYLYSSAGFYTTNNSQWDFITSIYE